MICVDCIVTAECNGCKPPKWDKTMNIDSMSVLIKAASITLV
jgi:hypothetical protein